jgi:hypothetical protein
MTHLRKLMLEELERRNVGFQQYGTPRFQNLSPQGPPLHDQVEEYT